MTKVRMLQSIAGGAEPMYSLPEFSFKPGDHVELDDTLAGYWIAAGHAEAAPAVVDIRLLKKSDLLAHANDTLKLGLASGLSRSDIIAAIEASLATFEAAVPIQRGN